MRKLIGVFMLVLSVGITNAQSEYAKYTIDGKEHVVEVDDQIMASMLAGSNVMLSATDGAGNSVTIMVPAEEIGEFKVGSGYVTNTVTITETMSDVYIIKSGTIKISKIEGKTYSGSFSGEFAKTTNGDVSKKKITGSFKIALDM